MKTYKRVLRFLCEHPWALLPARLEAIIELLELRVSGQMLTDEEIQARIGSAPRPTAETVNTVAVLPLHGIIAPRMNVMTQVSGGTSTEQFGAMLRRAVDDPGISAVVLDVDSPGGSVFGVEELADTMRSLRGRKPIVAAVNTMAASAAYWIGSQADEIIASPSSQLGSIGVVGIHQDVSEAQAKLGIKTTLISAGKHKVDGNSLEPLSDDARATMQAMVDGYYAAFIRDVAKGRGVAATAVRDGFGEGRVVSAREAVKLGMADRVGTIHQAIGHAASGKVTAGPRAAIDIGAPMVKPDENGRCPEGYHKIDTDDGPMCEPNAKAETPAVDVSAEATAAAAREQEEHAQAEAVKAEVEDFRRRLQALGA